MDKDKIAMAVDGVISAVTKAMASSAKPEPASGGAEELDFTAEDEKILDKIWDSLSDEDDTE